MYARKVLPNLVAPQLNPQAVQMAGMQAPMIQQPKEPKGLLDQMGGLGGMGMLGLLNKKPEEMPSINWTPTDGVGYDPLMSGDFMPSSEQLGATDPQMTGGYPSLGQLQDPKQMMANPGMLGWLRSLFGG